ncbi:class I SAM-dependent methyltransferase [Xanthobacteraceae bacterium Astr-EGSB]|uniref:class I SAM-dependent methyltransferase n=1 Tax=Astrobacterium formosum TaxID=3069710 RepID=UPI0027B82995|nr:class I SAM-dependent methyltransferase [Xanthobacteraceae bacterium Astr-EGSB]
MKGRESGMPDEACWASFFDAEKAVACLLGTCGVQGDAVEFGSGYGTFTLPAARRTTGWVSALDIEAELVDRVRQKAEGARLTNIRPLIRDFVADGTGLGDGTQAHAMIYNLLHLEDPIGLLSEAHRILASGGTLSVTHWRSDIETPRGPPLDIRPRPEDCMAWMRQAGFLAIECVDLEDCCPFHFGLRGRRRSSHRAHNP